MLWSDLRQTTTASYIYGAPQKSKLTYGISTTLAWVAIETVFHHIHLNMLAVNDRRAALPPSQLLDVT